MEQEAKSEFYCRYYQAILTDDVVCNKCLIRCVHSGCKSEQDYKHKKAT